MRLSVKKLVDIINEGSIITGKTAVFLPGCTYILISTRFFCIRLAANTMPRLYILYNSHNVLLITNVGKPNTKGKKIRYFTRSLT